MDRLNLKDTTPMFYASDGSKMLLTDMSLEQLADAKFELLDKLSRHKQKTDKIKQVINDIDTEAERRGYRIMEEKVPPRFIKQ